MRRAHVIGYIATGLVAFGLGNAAAGSASTAAAPTASSAPASTSTVTSTVTAPASSSSAPAAAVTSVTSGPGKYDQTWKTPYGDTKCAQWASSMTDQQRFVAAHDFVVSLKVKSQDQSDPFVKRLATSMSEVCKASPSTEIATAFATIVVGAPGDFPNVP